jgi:hypothetical protein
MKNVFLAIALVGALGLMVGCSGGCGCEPNPCCEPVYASPCCPAPSQGMGYDSGSAPAGGGGSSCGGSGGSCG